MVPKSPVALIRSHDLIAGIQLPNRDNDWALRRTIHFGMHRREANVGEGHRQREGPAFAEREWDIIA
jgi:hypothetical protein